MNQNLSKKNVDHRQKSRFGNSFIETRSANYSNHMDLGAYEVDNLHSSDHNNSDHVFHQCWIILSSSEETVGG